MNRGMNLKCTYLSVKAIAQCVRNCHTHSWPRFNPHHHILSPEMSRGNFWAQSQVPLGDTGYSPPLENPKSNALFSVMETDSKYHISCMTSHIRHFGWLLPKVIGWFQVLKAKMVGKEHDRVVLYLAYGDLMVVCMCRTML